MAALSNNYLFPTCCNLVLCSAHFYTLQSIDFKNEYILLSQLQPHGTIPIKSLIFFQNVVPNIFFNEATVAYIRLCHY